MAAGLWTVCSRSPFELVRYYFSLWFVAERYVYLASAGWAWLAGAAFACAAEAVARRKSPAARVPALALGALLACCAAGVAEADLLWSSSIVNIEAAAVREPDSPMARYALGVVYLRDLRSFSRAKREFAAAEALAPGNRPFAASCLQGRASAELGLRDEGAAERDLRASLEAYPLRQVAWGLLGALELRQNRERMGWRDLDNGARYPPKSNLAPGRKSSVGAFAGLSVDYLQKLDPSPRGVELLRSLRGRRPE
jgi:hypothetical protein